VHQRCQELHRPVPPTGITLDANSVPRIRDTGIDAAAIAVELGPDRLSDEEVLSRHPDLYPADLEAVKAHNTSRVQFDVLLDRVFTRPQPSPADVLDVYLFAPRIVPSYRKHENMAVPMKVRSSFEAANTDMANVEPSWIKAIGCLVFLDHIGGALKRTDVRASSSTSNLERTLERFSELTPDEAAGIYALRNSLVHGFCLVNRPKQTKTASEAPRRRQMVHAFHANLDPGPLIEFPEPRWDGDVNSIRPTTVSFAALTDLVEHVRARIFECYDDRTLKLRLSAAETRRDFIFVHGASMDEFQAQQQADDNARWPRSH
jgi:uncharacterized protein (DUF433 family)